MSQPPDRLLLTCKEAARCLSISRSALYELLGAGTIPSIVIGSRSRRVPKLWLEQYVARQVGEWERRHGDALGNVR